MTEGLEGYVSLIEAALPTYLDASSIPAGLYEAMHYALLAGGKRIRPGLTLITTELLGGNPQDALTTACAIEMIHTYSLIHDDLPAMDDDELRRGKPTVHIQFDEATAILAGDALQSLAFQIIASDPRLTDNTRLTLVRDLSRAIGPAGMVAGQVLDMASEKQSISERALEEIHNRKTGDLIAASVMAGATIAGAPEAETAALSRFGYALGLAFQVRDDLLDVLSNTETLGKPQGSDARQGKNTFTSLFGVDGARQRLGNLHQEAIDALEPLGQHAAPLIELTRYVVERIR